MSFSTSHLLYEIDRYASVVPPWLQILVASYLAVVLATTASGRVRERRGLLVSVILFVIAALLAVRAGSLLVALLS